MLAPANSLIQFDDSVAEGEAFCLNSVGNLTHGKTPFLDNIPHGSAYTSRIVW